MSEQQSPDAGPTPTDAGRTPDFELPRHNAIREDNWAEYEARGFTPVSLPFRYAQMIFGVEHVYSGDAFSWKEERPLRHKPGSGVYVAPEGEQFAIEQEREREERHRQRQEREEADAREKPGEE